MQVEVYKTDVKKKQDAKIIVTEILRIEPHSKVNFDLEDCDKILRVERTTQDSISISQLVINLGYICEELP